MSAKFPQIAELERLEHNALMQASMQHLPVWLDGRGFYERESLIEHIKEQFAIKKAEALEEIKQTFAGVEVETPTEVSVSGRRRRSKDTVAEEV